MTLTLELDHNTHATLVSCYAPTMASTEQGKDEFYNQLRDVISGCHHRDKLILMGDFTARIGTDYQTTFHLKHTRLQKSSVPKRINVLPLKTVEKHVELSVKLDTALNTVDINGDIESSWKAFRDATHTAPEEVLRLPVPKHQDWFNDNSTDVQQLIDKMHSSHKTWINDKSSPRKENAYQKSRGQVLRALRQIRVVSQGY
ncbi:Hypothetical predicted protein [Octopus vulgaris]|uniref:Endonuclease/exonuclease/phosphatase domain-containing protein n=1 Tax=Octopus vulgaris TaxID=6645 RepID=A0AA36BMH3_OCTVU|nr:Hypothetical predicted protein [Octopus vulgaris]